MGATENLQQSILEAMNLLSMKNAKDINAVKIIKGEVVELLDGGKRQYSVSCGGTLYDDAYAVTGASYTPSTIVWLLVPGGDLDQKKTILNAVDPSSNQYVDEDAISRDIVNPDNLLSIEGLEDGQIKLRTWETIDKEYSIKTDRFNQLFINYLKEYNRVLFSAEIHTEIDAKHQLDNGNYGLVLTVYYKNKETDAIEPRNYTMDVNTIEGNPYNFTVYQNVELYYDIGDVWEYCYDDEHQPSLHAFVRDFKYTEEDQVTGYDVYIRNIQFRMSQYLTEENITGYYVTLNSNNGYYFKDEGEYSVSKLITPSLKVNGRDTSVQDWDCYWFVEDSSVDTTHPNYLKIGGIGWKCLNEKTDEQINSEGRSTFQYIVNKYQYTVKKDYVQYSLKYKCILVKDGIVTNPGIIEITKLDTKYEASLESATGSNIFVEGIGKVRLKATLKVKNGGTSFKTYWQRFDKNKNYLDDDFYIVEQDCIPTYYDNHVVEYTTIISFDCSLVDKVNIINCTFCYNDMSNNDEIKQVNLTTRSLTITTSPELTYTLSIVGGDVLYKYDPNGDSPLVGDYDGPVSSQLKEIAPISYAIYKPDGSELTQEEYLQVKYKWSFPKNSMMKLQNQMVISNDDDNYYYIEGERTGIQPLYYNILDVYNKIKSNNTILLTVNFNGIILNNSVTPQFLKDGEGGTNGSKYAALIQYNEHYFGDLDAEGNGYKFHAIYIGQDSVIDNVTNDFKYPKGWYVYDIQNKELIPFSNANKTLEVVVFKDGVPFNNDGYTISWSTFDSTATEPCILCSSQGTLELKKVPVGSGGATKNIDWDDDKETFCSIAQCCVTITNDEHEEKIYCYYPIEITRIQKLNDEDLTIPSLEGGFYNVLYASDGTNPQYDNANPFVCKDNIHNEKYSVYEWDCNENLKCHEYQDEKLNDEGKIELVNNPAKSRVRPITQFLNGETKNYVKVSLRRNPDEEAYIEDDYNNLVNNHALDIDLRDYYYKPETTGEPSDIVGKLLDFNEFLSYNKEEEDKKYLFDRYISKLDKTKTLLEIRFNMLDILKSLNDCVHNDYLYVKNRVDVNDYTFIRDYSNITADLLARYKHIYLLGYNYKLQDLEDDFLDVSLTPNQNIKTKYDITVYGRIESFATEWDQLKVTYNTLLKNELLIKDDTDQYIHQSEWNALNEILVGRNSSGENSKNHIDPEEALVNLPINSPLGDLATSAIPQTDPKQYIQEFLDAKQQVELYLSKITKESSLTIDSGEIISYDTYVNNLILPIQRILEKYFVLDNEKKNERQEYYKQLSKEYGEKAIALEPDITHYKFLLDELDTALIHIRPIIMTTNRYEMAHINAWDGNKIYVDEKNGEYLLAPQVGAGMKDNEGKFTGMIMGIRSFDKKVTKSQQHIGLFGYHRGDQSLFLNSKDGSATFGKSGTGQIIIDPTADKGLIYSSSFWKKYNDQDSELKDGKPIDYTKSNYNGRGMLIDLTTPEIRFGNGNFSVTSDGNIHGMQGDIGGWKIDDDSIHSQVQESQGRITLKSHSNIDNGYEATMNVDSTTNADVIIYVKEAENVSPSGEINYSIDSIGYRNEYYDISEKTKDSITIDDSDMGAIILKANNDTDDFMSSEWIGQYIEGKSPVAVQDNYKGYKYTMKIDIIYIIKKEDDQYSISGLYYNDTQYNEDKITLVWKTDEEKTVITITLSDNPDDKLILKTPVNLSDSIHIKAYADAHIESGTLINNNRPKENYEIEQNIIFGLDKNNNFASTIDYGDYTFHSFECTYENNKSYIKIPSALEPSIVLEIPNRLDTSSNRKAYIKNHKTIGIYSFIKKYTLNTHLNMHFVIQETRTGSGTDITYTYSIIGIKLLNPDEDWTGTFNFTSNSLQLKIGSSDNKPLVVHMNDDLTSSTKIKNYMDGKEPVGDPVVVDSTHTNYIYEYMSDNNIKDIVIKKESKEYSLVSQPSYTFNDINGVGMTILSDGTQLGIAYEGKEIIVTLDYNLSNEGLEQCATSLTPTSIESEIKGYEISSTTNLFINFIEDNSGYYDISYIKFGEYILLELNPLKDRIVASLGNKEIYFLTENDFSTSDSIEEYIYDTQIPIADSFTAYSDKIEYEEVIMYIEEIKNEYSLEYIKYQGDMYKVIESSGVMIRTNKVGSLVETIFTSFVELDTSRHIFDYIQNLSVIDKYADGTGPGCFYSNKHDSLRNGTVGFYLSNDGLSIGSKILIDANGVVKVGTNAVTNKNNKHWTIDGTSDYSYIAYNTVKSYITTNDNVVNISDSAGSNQVYLGTNGIRLGKKFAVDKDGNMVAHYLVANQGGSIAGWQINGRTLKGNGISINSGGSIEADNGSWSISSSGRARFNDLVASSSGTIGGWTIGPNSLSNAASGLTLGIGGLVGPGFSVNASGFRASNPNGGSSLNWGSNFSVSTNGTLTCRNANVQGTITAGSGSIGGWNITSSGLEKGSFKIISNNGYIFCGLVSCSGVISMNGKTVAVKEEIPSGTYSVKGTINGGAIPYDLYIEI